MNSGNGPKIDDMIREDLEQGKHSARKPPKLIIQQKYKNFKINYENYNKFVEISSLSKENLSSPKYGRPLQPKLLDTRTTNISSSMMTVTIDLVETSSLSKKC